MKYYLLSLIFTVIGVCNAAEPTIMLDFGSATSPLYEGFTRVTREGGDNVKWETKAELKEIENKIKRWKKANFDDVYYTSLNCDYVYGNGAAELKLSVPAGNYKVWVLLGNPAGGESKVWNSRISTNSDSAEINIPGNCGMRYALLNAAADKSGLTVRFDTANSWMINGMVVIPATDWDTLAETVIAPLWKEYEFVPKDLQANWKEVKQPILQKYPEPKWTEQQQKDGFVIFSRSMITAVWPTEFPASWEIDAPVRAFAAQNEFETLSFSIHALQKFRNISLKVSDMVSAEGHRLPGEFRQDYIHYMYTREFFNTTLNYFIGPDAVMPWKSQKLEKGKNLTIWLTANIQPLTPPGEYKGTAELNLDGKIKNIPISLKVLPITLIQDTHKHQAIYLRNPYQKAAEATDDFSRNWFLKKMDSELSELREAGITNYPQMHLLGTWQKDRWVYEYDTFGQIVEVGRKYGFQGPIVCGFPFRFLYTKYMKESQGEHLNNLKKMPPEEFFAELTSMIREITTEARNRNWPELLFYPVDEPSPSTLQMQFLTRCLQAIKAGGGKSFVTTESEDIPTHVLRPYLDVWCGPKFSNTAEEIAEVRKKYPNGEYWCYPGWIAGNDHVAAQCARFTYGFGFWKSGYQGLFLWHFSYPDGDPWNSLDGHEADTMNRSGNDGSVMPSPNWFGLREGMDDGRYIYTLECWINTARRAGFKDDAAEAEAFLKGQKDSIPVLHRYYNPDVWSAESTDVVRWQMAQRIMKLEKLVNNK